MSVSPTAARKTVLGSGCGEAASERERPEFGANARRTFSINKPRRILDFSCGDPYYHVRQEHRAVFRSPLPQGRTTEQRLAATVDGLNKFPILKRNVQSQLEAFKADRRQESGLGGQDGAERSKMYLKER